MTHVKTAVTAAILVLVAGAAIGFSQAREEDDVQVAIDQVPPAVRKTIEARLAGGTIEEIERSSDGGKVVYEVEIAGRDGAFEFVVAEDGTVLGMDKEDDGDDDENGKGEDEQGDDEQETVIPIGEAPAEVRASFDRVAGGSPATRVERIVHHGLTKYEIEFERGGVPATIAMSQRGDIMGIELAVQTPDLPETVRTALQKAFPGSSIVEAESIQLFFYEVVLRHNGKKREVVVLASGAVDDDAEGDDDDDEDDEDDKGNHD